MKNHTRMLLLLLSFFATACSPDLEQLAQDNLYPLKIANKTKVPDAPPENYTQALLDVSHPDGDMKAHLWAYRNPTDTNAPVIIHFHGNGENIGSLHKGNFLKAIERTGFNFVVFDFPGYGKSTGVPSQSTIMADSQAVLEWTRQNFPNSKIHLWGWSIGSAIAIQTALQNQNAVSSAVFSSPFKNVYSLAVFHFGSMVEKLSKDWLDRNAWKSNEVAQSIHLPVLLTHGTKDKNIPFQFGKELFLHFPESSSSFIAYEGSAHADFFSKQQYWDDLKQFLRSH